MNYYKIKLFHNRIPPTTRLPGLSPKKPDASGKRKVRLVIDYRKLNDKTIEDKFPLPNIDDLFGKIGKATYFSASLRVPPNRDRSRIDTQNSFLYR